MQRTWVCPQCEDAVRAPSVPRKDDVRRYCLPCSKRTGKLVQRTCPALEKRRAERGAANKARHKARAERARERELKHYTVGGVNLKAEARTLWRLLKNAEGFHPVAEPAMRIRRSRRTRYGGKLGHYDPRRHEIMIRDYPGITPHDVRETLAHELVHARIDRGLHDGWHGPTFKRTLWHLMREAYGATGEGVIRNRFHGRYAAALRNKEKEGQE